MEPPTRDTTLHTPWFLLVYSESTTFKTLKSVTRVTGFNAGMRLEVQNEVERWLEKNRKRQERGQLGGRLHIKKELGTEQSTQLTQPCERGERVPAKRAPAQKRTGAAALDVESPRKRRVQDDPIRGDWDVWDATPLVSQLAPGLRDVMRSTMTDVVPDVVEKSMALGSKTREERAVEQASKREREAKELILQ